MPGHAASGMIVANRLRLDICSLVAGITVREGLHALPTLNDQQRRWAIFAITAANFFLSQFYRATNAVIAPQLTADLRLDTADLGFLSAAFFYAFALTQIPLSIFLDRVGARRMMTGLGVAGVVGAVAFASADSLSMGVFGRLLLGIGMACNLMGTLKLMTSWFSPLHFATLSGIVFAIGTIGNMAATTPLVLLVDLVGWRWAFLTVAAANLVLVAALYAVVRDAPDKGKDRTEKGAEGGGGHSIARLAVLLKNRDYWIISTGSFVGYGIFASFQTLWAGPYLMKVMGLTPVQTGNLIFLLNVGMILGSPFWGGVSDRLVRTRKWIIVLGLATFAAMTGILAILPAGMAFVWLALLITTLGMFRASGQLMYTHIKERMPSEMAGMAMTGINFFTMIGPAAFLHGLGALMQRIFPGDSQGPAAFSAALLLCSGCLAAVTLLYCFSRDTRDLRRPVG